MPPKESIYNKYRKYKKLYQKLVGGARGKQSSSTSDLILISHHLTQVLSTENISEYPGIRDYSNNQNLDNIRYRLSFADNLRDGRITFWGTQPDQHPYHPQPPLDIPSLGIKLETSFLEPNPISSQTGLPYLPGCDFYQICDKSSKVGKRIHLIGSGTYGSAFGVKFSSPEEASRLTNNPPQYQFICKMVAYENITLDLEDTAEQYNYWDYPITDPKRPENVEVLTADLFKRLFLDRDHCVTPHIILPIMAFRCPYTDSSEPSDLGGNSVAQLLTLLSKDKQKQIHRNYRTAYSDQALARWAQDYQGPQGRITSTTRPVADNRHQLQRYLAEQAKKYIQSLNPSQDMLLYVTEFAGHGSMIDWMWPPKPDTSWKILLFQLMYTMAVIQDRLPDWRHNDLSPSNILIQKITVTPETQGAGYLYQWGDHWYFIPVTDFSIRLWDFDFANCTQLPNYKVYAQPDPTDPSTIYTNFTEYGILPTPCLQYDLHFLFNYLATYYRGHYQKIPDVPKQLVTEWLPEMLTGNHNTKWITDTARITSSAQIGKHNLSKVTTSVLEKTPTAVNTREIPYSELTARRQLEQHPIFSEFQVTSTQLDDLLERSRRGDTSVVINYFRYPTPR
jgi:hypothetical protein